MSLKAARTKQREIKSYSNQTSENNDYVHIEANLPRGIFFFIFPIGIVFKLLFILKQVIILRLLITIS